MVSDSSLTDSTSSDSDPDQTPGITVDVNPWAGVIGQGEAKDRLQVAAQAPVHAYLFLGTQGSGTLRAARGFAGLILAADLSDEVEQARAITLATEGKHPDVIIVEPQGAALRVTEAEEIIRAGLRTPVESRRKVIVVTGAEAIEEAAIGKLLKVIEEPPPSAVFVLLAEEVPPEIVTIVSRCVTVEFGPLSARDLQTALLDEGVDAERAEAAAAAAGGDLDRARLLATDDDLAARAASWQRIPGRLDGTGFVATEMVNEVRAGMDGAQGPLEARQAGDLEELEARVEQMGERGSGRTELVARHKRQIRRLRYDELRFGLATMARVYRDHLVDGVAGLELSETETHEALAAIQTASENLVRNPNEALLLQELFLTLSPRPAG